MKVFQYIISSNLRNFRAVTTVLYHEEIFSNEKLFCNDNTRKNCYLCVFNSIKFHFFYTLTSTLKLQKYMQH